MKQAFAIGFAFGGMLSWFAPGFSGVFASPTVVSTGDGQIVGAILLVGAAVLWFMPET